MWRMWLHRLRKLTRISRGERAELIRAQWVLIQAQVLVWTRPVGRLVDTNAPPSVGLEMPTVAPVDSPARLALAVKRAAEHGVFRPACLVRSVALQRLLESNGIEGSRIRIGVRMQGGRFAAHAWVERDGVVLGDEARHVRQFTELTDVRMVSLS